MPRFHRSTRALAFALSTLAVAAAPAAAMPIDPPIGGPAPGARTAPPADGPTRPPQVRSIDTGLDWASAALGGGAVGIVALGSLGALAVTGRGRVPRTR
jgi:hypothetical protein